MHFHCHERVYTGEPDEEVCNCIQVLRCEIQEEIEGGAPTVQQVSDRCGAGGGCGECHPEIARLLRVQIGGDLPEASGGALDAIETILRPLAQRIGAQVRVQSHDAYELVLAVEGGEPEKQTIALWAEQVVDPLLSAECFLEVE